MYTTIEIIKRGEACRGGFSRQLAFFGQSKEIRSQHIPLHVIALLGGEEDINWVTTSGMIIDPVQFAAFRTRTIVAVWMHMFHAHEKYNSRKAKNPLWQSTDEKKHQHILPLLDRALKLRSEEEIDSFIKEMNFMNYEHWLFTNCVRKKLWSSPAVYINHCVEMAGAEMQERHSSTEALRAYYIAKEAAESATQLTQQAMLRLRQPETVTADGVTEQHEVENGYSDDSEEEDENDWGSPTKEKFPVFGFKFTAKSKGKLIAQLLCPEGEGLYDFLHRLKYKTPKGLTIKSTETTFKASITNMSPAKTFDLLKMLNSRTGLPDQV